MKSIGEVMEDMTKRFDVNPELRRHLKQVIIEEKREKHWELDHERELSVGCEKCGAMPGERCRQDPSSAMPTMNHPLVFRQMAAGDV
jgi:hypothetical protein